MPGIEKLVEEIRKQGEAAVAALRATDAARVDAIRAKGESEAREEYARLTEKAEAEAAKRVALAESSMASESVKAALQAKVREVDAVVEEALKRLTDMDDAGYFAVLEGLILSKAPAGGSELLLNRRDADRLPSGFMEEINKKLGSKRAVTLSPERADIIGGCVIRRGLVEENCAFDALVTEKNEEIRDSAAAILFG